MYWLCRSYFLSHLSWPFMINDLNKTFAYNFNLWLLPAYATSQMRDSVKLKRFLHQRAVKTMETMNSNLIRMWMLKRCTKFQQLKLIWPSNSQLNILIKGLVLEILRLIQLLLRRENLLLLKPLLFDRKQDLHRPGLERIFLGHYSLCQLFDSPAGVE